MSTIQHHHSPEWLQGMAAARQGASHEENPFLDGPEQTLRSRQWSDGYWYGRRDLDGEVSA